MTENESEEMTQPIVHEPPQANLDEVQSTNLTVADPFEEEFADEEEVLDQYAPLVAAQNESSLSVTKEDIGLIQPLQDSATNAEPLANGFAEEDAPDESWSTNMHRQQDSVQNANEAEIQAGVSRAPYRSRLI